MKLTQNRSSLKRYSLQGKLLVRPENTCRRNHPERHWNKPEQRCKVQWVRRRHPGSTWGYMLHSKHPQCSPLCRCCTLGLLKLLIPTGKLSQPEFLHLDNCKKTVFLKSSQRNQIMYHLRRPQYPIWFVLPKYLYLLPFQREGENWRYNQKGLNQIYVFVNL